MTITLAIEVSNPSASPDACAVALARVRTDSAIEDLGAGVMPRNARGSDGVMALIDHVCAQASIAPSDLDAIAVSIGPGGYTALRIATTTAKVLARTLGCALIPVPSVLVAAQRIEQSELPAMIALASKGAKAWCAVVRADEHNERTIEELGVIDPSGARWTGIRQLIADSHLPKGFCEHADEHAIELRPLVLDARDCLLASIGRDPIDPAAMSPLYAREPDAVTQWRDRHG
jgi:tRNA threonylcarbamoyl adenosine modification protein YeaZ